MKKTFFFSVYFLTVLLIFITCSKDDPTPEPIPVITYTLTSTSSPSNGGTISPASGTYKKGETVTLTATASTNFVFKNWSGGASGTENPVTITFNSNKVVTAVFEEVPPIYMNGEGEIGALGGTVTIEDESSPLNGIKIEIPEGALETIENIKILLAEEDVKFSPDELVQLIKFEPEGLTFSKPIEVTFPYDSSIQDTTKLVVINYIPDPETIDFKVRKKIDIENKTITAFIEHFSYYSAYEKRIRLNVEMVKYDNKVGVRLQLFGEQDKGQGFGEGFEYIPTVKNHSSHSNILECMNVNYGSHNYKSSEFELELRTATSVKQTVKLQFYEYESRIYVYVDGNQKYSSRDLIIGDIDLTNKNTTGYWFGADPIVIWFDNYQPDTSHNLYVNVDWRFSNAFIEHSTPTDIFSPTYEFWNYSKRMKIGEMATFSNDSNPKNFIHDDFDPKAPQVETLQASNIQQFSARLNGNIISDGGANITEKGFYVATHSNPTENDLIVEASSSGFYAIPDLESNYNYHYRAYAKNSVGLTVADEIIHFETLNVPPTVQITEPVANSSFQKGELVTIKATADDNDGGLKSVKIYIDNVLKKTYTTTQSTYTYDWDSSNSNIGNVEIKVIATDSKDDTKTAIRAVEIRDGNITVIKPNSSTIWQEGDQNVEITWDTGNLGGNVTIELYEGSNKHTLTSQTENDGSYLGYSVQENIKASDQYSVKIISNTYPSKMDTSSKFEIKKADNFAPSFNSSEYPNDGDNIDTTSETLFWECTDPENDILTYDVYFGTSGTTLTLKSEGQTTNTYNVPNLTQGQTYDWYIIANDGNGNTTQSPTWHFSVAVQTTKATVTTTTPTNSTINSATVGGNVTSDGGTSVTETGVYWSTSANAETTGTKFPIGTGIGIYSASLTGLIANTPYYIKAYAINSNGTAYGSELTFSTLASIGNINLTMQNADGTSQTYPGTNGEVQLYKNNTLQSVTTTNSNGIAQFTNITTGEYEARFYHNANLSTPHGEEYWGKKIITVLTDQTVEETFIRYMPYISEGVTVYADGVDVSGTSVATNTELTFVVKVKNDGSSVQGKTRLILDIDKVSSYNYDQTSTSQSLGSLGGITEFSFTYTPTDIGDYYYTVNAQGNIAELGGYLVSDGWDWSQQALFRVEGGSTNSGNILFNPNLTYGSVTDNDGNTYKTIQIGTQTWMAENLKTTKYQNGDAIPNVTDNTSWTNLSTGAYANYNNDANNVATYGRLYNWYAVNDSRKLCPQNWHVPTDTEWKTLEMYLGMSTTEANDIGWRGTDEGGKLKEIGTAHWNSPNTGATNSSGFTALPGGCRTNDYGNFGLIGANGFWWSASEFDTSRAWLRNLDYYISDVYRNLTNKRSGFCVRCVRD